MMNQSFIIGRLTKDLELKVTSNGKSVVQFAIACNRDVKKEDGTTVADFISCVAYGKTAEVMAQYLHKGSLLAVNGRIQTRNYENQQGQKVYITEILVERVQFLDSKPQQQTQPMQQYQQPMNYQQPMQQYNQFNQYQQPMNQQTYQDPQYQTMNISPDDLPF